MDGCMLMNKKPHKDEKETKKGRKSRRKKREKKSIRSSILCNYVTCIYSSSAYHFFDWFILWFQPWSRRLQLPECKMPLHNYARVHACIGKQLHTRNLLEIYVNPGVQSKRKDASSCAWQANKLILWTYMHKPYWVLPLPLFPLG